MVKEDRCATHGSHTIYRATMDLDGACAAVPDYPVIPPRLCLAPVPFLVFDASLYCEPDYCTGDDEVSRALMAGQRWEGFETSVALDILSATTRAWMLDIGSHVGWYSTIAARLGHSVIAFDADKEHLELLARNTRGYPVTPTHCWIDENTRPINSPHGAIRLVKIDLEGHECNAIRMIEPLLPRVEYVLVELSPEFSIQGPVVESMRDHGFSPYLVPDKGYRGTFAEPLAETLTFPLTDALKSQRTVLFVNNER